MDLLVSTAKMRCLSTSSMCSMPPCLGRNRNSPAASGYSTLPTIRKRFRDRAEPGRSGARRTKPVQPQHIEFGSWHGQQRSRECRDHNGQHQLAGRRRSLRHNQCPDTASARGQIQDLETQMVGIANSTNEGRYLFGGDSDAAAPYSINYANTPPFTAERRPQPPDWASMRWGTRFRSP